MIKKIEQAMELLSFSPNELLENMSENDKKEFLSGCHLIFTNHVFGRIFDEVYTREILDTIANANDSISLAEGRGKIFGIAGVMDLIKDYHLQYLDSIKKEEKLSKEEEQEII